MSFNPFAPEVHIINRLKTHAALVSATQGIYNTAAPDTIELGPGLQPIVVLTHISGTFANTTFRTNIAESLYQVSVYDSKLNGSGAVPAQTVMGYVFGDSEGTDNAPTFGLHRWEISGVTDMADATMVAETYGTQHDSEVLHYFMTFRMEVQEA